MQGFLQAGIVFHEETHWSGLLSDCFGYAFDDNHEQPSGGADYCDVIAFCWL